MASTPPVAPHKSTTFPALHGCRRTDDYAWLKDENWQQVMRDPDTLRGDIREYLEAENADKETALAPAETLRATLFEEFRRRIKQDDSSVPAKDGGWAYYQRFCEGGQHPVVCRRVVDDSVRGGVGTRASGLSGHTTGDLVDSGGEVDDTLGHAAGDADRCRSRRGGECSSRRFTAHADGCDGG